MNQLRANILSAPRGCVRRAGPGDKLSMHYTGTLASTGAKFDSSHDRDRPFDFTLGVGQVYTEVVVKIVIIIVGLLTVFLNFGALE